MPLCLEHFAEGSGRAADSHAFPLQQITGMDQFSKDHQQSRLTWPRMRDNIRICRAERGTKGSLTLMINGAKSPCFCIPMVPRLSGGHVTCVEEIGGER
ncbi:hypothetical protein Q7C36_011628 [Tachysurus vachellii]|uniref:Uncharacterized protein n=1 Tax=Tachysurus vachellii TaxID=175792 RepID=A0AA88MUI0_TACVA|nr:hypothetical protein Q7C36_011628 [Tachysurus vachellii]